ncbi:MAG: YqgE/AlgH family protein [Gammaproteobacteria bacterium]
MPLENIRLGGQLLLALPSLTDPRFSGSVVLMCEHGEEGALGLIVNRPMQLNLGTVLKQLNLRADHAEVAERTVFSGGPVETQRGFVIHDAPGRFADSLSLGETLGVSSSEQILDAISQGAGPERFIIALGYAGWGPGQIENELRENTWLPVPATAEVIFDTSIKDRWRQAAIQIGIDPLQLSSESGHA